MRIVCPHCTTSYVVDLATLGPAGRTVRCSRCKEVWLARPEDALEPEAAEATQPAVKDVAAEWEALARDDHTEPTTAVESPSIGADWASMARHEASDGEAPQAASRTTPPHSRATGKSLANLGIACAVMGALVLALVIWRIEVVRLLPQTAAFYRLVGLEVNLRGLSFRDLKVTAENAEGKPVLVIEGVIVGTSRKPVDLPRLRFSVRDSQGAEIYAWNTVLEQSVLQPGEMASFKSRLASPPPEGRNIDIRFFNRRDIAGGKA